ncbi:MAG: DoxX family protein [Phycisphaerales bacterium]|nr:DoxX family protein [Phycisphaerales bacterium]
MRTALTVLLGSTRSSSWATSAGLLVLRFGAGLLLITVFEKFMPRDGVWGPQQWFVDDVAKMGFPMPRAFAWAAVLSEFFGGMLLIVGLLARPAAFFIAVTTFVAAFVYHQQPLQQGLTAVIYFFMSISLMLAGPGRISLDALLARRFLCAISPTNTARHG